MDGAGLVIALEGWVLAVHTEDAIMVVVSMVILASVDCCRGVVVLAKL